ncbi:1-phosphofructokinase [Lacticaseibacillus sharpeae]|uniref:Tagatose-6-phosphate kinase n=1 Tax=Lacticaseibacillus sharpeae JCM 1186 = DSM 20505 TaxID=1291052 RepID=A0A0R1ZQ64_9LACO|nr:1-phosphofructokinase [Lacticaseibacillus sharpeae]KRM56514.1 tagatose-6-phosphate kinase [Lacticaseibacillus sharpeae JCM 1186 = DSM 20505]
MIYSITLNPAIDYVIGLPKLELGLVNRLDTAIKLPGGKGINVSRILKELDIDTTAWGFTGGMPGRFIEEQLQALSLRTDFTRINGDTRINVKLKADQETELNAPGPQITDDEVAAFRARFNQLQQGDVVIMAGSIPAGLPESFYRDLIPLIHEHGADFVIDTTGQALLDTLPSKPLVVKPNHHELAELFGDAEYPDLQATVAAGRKLLGLGAKHVLVSMAGAGALMITADKAWHGTVPKGDVKNSVGAGDSMLAGFTGTFARTHDPLLAFKKAIACGSATAFSTDLADRAKIDEVEATISIEEI